MSKKSKARKDYRPTLKKERDYKFLWDCFLGIIEITKTKKEFSLTFKILTEVKTAIEKSEKMINDKVKS